MEKSEFDSLDIGDLIRAKWNGEVYVVVYSAGNNTYVVNRTLTATNPSEWDLVMRHRKNGEGFDLYPTYYVARLERRIAELEGLKICCAWCGTETTVGVAKIERNLLWCEPCDTWQEYEGVE